jgi:short-subunit dehydrogenase
MESLAARLFADDQGVDLLFNNAGIGHAGFVADTPLEDWRRVLDVNLMGVVNGVHAFVPKMLAREASAHIVNTASLAGLVPNPGLVPYSTSKAGVVGLSLALDTELRHKGIRVHALCPGIIDTAIVGTSTMRGAWADRQQRATRFYAKRGTSPDVVARDALRGVERNRTIIPSPRWQASPTWALERFAPRLSRRASAAAMRVLG